MSFTPNVSKIHLQRSPPFLRAVAKAAVFVTVVLILSVLRTRQAVLFFVTAFKGLLLVPLSVALLFLCVALEILQKAMDSQWVNVVPYRTLDEIFWSEETTDSVMIGDDFQSIQLRSAVLRDSPMTTDGVGDMRSPSTEEDLVMSSSPADQPQSKLSRYFRGRTYSTKSAAPDLSATTQDFSGTRDKRVAEVKDKIREATPVLSMAPNSASVLKIGLGMLKDSRDYHKALSLYMTSSASLDKSKHSAKTHVLMDTDKNDHEQETSDPQEKPLRVKASKSSNTTVELVSVSTEQL